MCRNAKDQAKHVTTSPLVNWHSLLAKREREKEKKRESQEAARTQPLRAADLNSVGAGLASQTSNSTQPISKSRRGRCFGERERKRKREEKRETMGWVLRYREGNLLPQE